MPLLPLQPSSASASCFSPADKFLNFIKRRPFLFEAASRSAVRLAPGAAALLHWKRDLLQLLASNPPRVEAGEVERALQRRQQALHAQHQQEVSPLLLAAAGAQSFGLGALGCQQWALRACLVVWHWLEASWCGLAGRGCISCACRAA